MGALRDRVEAYFASFHTPSLEGIGAHFSPDACVYDLNVKPVRGRDTIAKFWLAVCEKWQDPRWTIDSLVEDAAAGAVAIEWTMAGRRDGVPFRVSGSEHYSFEDGLISEIRQYWIFDPKQPDHQLLGFPYAAEAVSAAR